MYFQYLRRTPWTPTFEWVKTSKQCADKINSYHEDYPKYVKVTGMVLQNTVPVGKILNRHLRLIHRTIFSDKSFAGKLREVDVRVGPHQPPQFSDLAKLMDKLCALYEILNIVELMEWYKDFETIHPFQDGNGRVGGVIVAVYSHAMRPEYGWLAPNQ